MKFHYNSTLVSALIWTFCLVTIIPGAASEASTWRQLYIDLGSTQTQNFWALFGLVDLGIVAIGLIVLWTGFRKRERWAWFVMLIVLLCFDFPSTWMPVFLSIHAGYTSWSDLLNLFSTFREAGWWQCMTIMPLPNEAVGMECFAVGVSIGLIRTLVMLVALLLPVKAFFLRSTRS